MKKPAAKPRPAAQRLPGKSTPATIPKPSSVSVPKPVQSSSTHPARSVPPPPPPPPPPKAEPEAEMYRAKFDFEGQEGEMSLKKDDVVELVQKDDNGLFLF